MSNNIQKVNTHWQELDVLRGLAAVLMVTNHLGYATLNATQSSSGVAGGLVFIGSFAPVLFFFVTGVGYGLQSHKKKTNRWYVTLNKVVVLFLADLMMRVPEGWLGLDFFGFIGLSGLVLELIRNSKSPLTYCFGGFVAISVMRYLLGPVLRVSGYDQQAWGLIGWIFGTYAAPGISYPLSPWLAYPLVGYLVGYAAARYRVSIEKYRLRVVFGLLILGAIPAIAGVIILNQHGSSLFRWGTVAFDFYVVSFAVILASLSFSLIVCAGTKLTVCQNVLSLQGIASFAVVPLHYFLLYLLVRLQALGLGLLDFCLLLTAVLIVSFLLAHSIESFSQLLRRVQQQKFVWSCLVATFLLALNTLILTPNNPFLVAATRAGGQIVLCLLFVIRPPIFSHFLLRRQTH
ncbi:MAG: DUF1624 domain-containing protein [Chroococcidiopsidaceae cyanobacterium CP_BM_ER_R8_30]|nr:DUF1624 domain-containing protein [Chroococcidiopsidaceae cyanobacterium CP_BM_ER_R8_30]